MHCINILSMSIIPEETETTVTQINSILIHNILDLIKAKSEYYLPSFMIFCFLEISSSCLLILIEPQKFAYKYSVYTLAIW